MTNPTLMETQASTSTPSTLAVGLLALAMLAWQGNELWLQWLHRQQLQQNLAAQQTQLEPAAKVRAALDTLATGTSGLAEKGNANALRVVNELRQRGITINEPAGGLPK